MHYFLYFINIGCSAGQSTLSKHYAVHGGKSEIFNINKALSGLLIFLVLGLIGGLHFHLPTVWFGLGYGLFLSMANHTGFQALSSGPMALTSSIASFSLLLPFLFGILILNESISVFGIVGIGLLCLSIVLLNLRKETGFSAKWAFYAFATLFCNGICSIIQKCHQIAYPQQYRMEFLIAAMLCVLGTTLLFAKRRLKETRLSVTKEGLLAGVMNGFSNYIILYLAATENASVLFPVVSVAQIMATCFIGRLVFKEKLRPLQIGGILLGIASILLLNLF